MRETRTSGSAGGGAKPIASPYPDHKHRACSDDTLLLQSLGYMDNEIGRMLKEWHRDWKIALIEQSNPEWTDLYPGLAA